MVVCMSFLSPTQPSDDDEYASSSSLLSSTASSSSSSSSSYTNSTATTIFGYTHNLNPTKTSNPVAQDLFDASRVVQILNSMKRDPKTAISFFDRLKEQGYASSTLPVPTDKTCSMLADCWKLKFKSRHNCSMKCFFRILNLFA